MLESMPAWFNCRQKSRSRGLTVGKNPAPNGLIVGIYADRKTMSSKSRKWIILSLAVALLLSAIGVGVWQYYRLMVCNIESKDGESHLVYVYPDTPMDSLVEQLKQEFDIHSELSWRLHSRWLKWRTVKSGAYRIDSIEGDLSVIRRLRNGEQTPVKVSFKVVRTPEQLASRLASQLMLDSAEIASRLLSEEYMARYSLTLPTAVCLFMPDTYEMYWNISADALFERAANEYRSFWNVKRRAKAEAMGLSPTEVATLASIVEGETFNSSEKSRVAGLYLNRLHRGMLLQADPTVIFAWQDFSIRRLLRRHLEIDSPYNTYKYAGLPPGPIRIPSAESIDACLNYEHHNYLYMCANSDFSFTHKFASSYSEHRKNAREYQRELNRRGIKK